MRSIKRSAVIVIVILSAVLAVSGCDHRKSDSQDSKELATCDGLPGIVGVPGNVTDGDTFKLRQANGETVIVRLDQIDAPEKAQPWANRSRQLLRELLGSGDICVVGRNHDKYRRLLGEVHANGVVVNREMIRQGGAWAYRQYLRDARLIDLEAEARDQKRGLWSMPADQTIAPWEFRHPELRGTTERPPSEQGDVLQGQASQAGECAKKPICRQMSSCEEARMWLGKCGGQGIDGDGDGIPCEAICSQ